MITIYTSPMCHKCLMMKAIMDREGIAYQELPLTDEIIEISGATEAPVFEYDGRYLVGYVPAPVIKDFINYGC